MSWQIHSSVASTSRTMSKKNIDIMRIIAEAQNEKKPRKKPGEEEHLIQVSCVNWFTLVHRNMRHQLFAVPNGGWRNEIVAGKLKAEGVLAGVSDLIFLHKNSQYGALLIEMKTPKGTQSDKQMEWQSLIEKDGYKYVVCHSRDEFEKEIENYLSIQ